jgi:hypothetical protein
MAHERFYLGTCQNSNLVYWHDSLKVFWRAVILVMFAAIVFVSVDISAHPASSPQTVQPVFSIHIVAVEPVFKAGSKILVDVTFENIADHDILLTSRWGNAGFEYPIDVWDEKGATAPETKYGRWKNNHKTAEDRADPIEISSSNSVDRTLNRGRSYTDRVSVSEVYDLSHPGKYTIQVRQYDEDSKSFAKSNKITVTIAP